MKYTFNQIFKEDDSGRLTPLRPIRIGAATFGSSVTFGPGVSFGGVNIFEYKGLDIDAEEDGEVLVIKGFYKV